jgi:histidine triad (HIT) family protein
MQQDTIFDKIMRKEIPSDIVYEDETVLAIKDINPQGPVHVLVLPKKKVTGFDRVEEMGEREAGKYIIAISKVAEKLNLKDGYRIVFNVGKHGQQTVPYIHAHVIGGRQMGWPPG